MIEHSLVGSSYMYLALEQVSRMDLRMYYKYYYLKGWLNFLLFYVAHSIPRNELIHANMR